MAQTQNQVTALLLDWSKGDEAALAKLLPVVYRELRRLAQRHLEQERRGHTMQATALLHEVYLRLVDQRVAAWENRAHFYGVCARLMRQILVDHARRRRAGKRGGGQGELSLDEPLDLGSSRARELLALDEALTALAAMDERASRIVELRFFGGLEIDETAEVLGISPATVKREWAVARAWLHRKLHRTG